MEFFLQELAKYGMPGIIIALLCFWLYTKDKQLVTERASQDKALQEERNARIADAQKYSETLIAFQKELLAAIGKLSDIAEKLSERRRP